jgi:hypothetical protein
MTLTLSSDQIVAGSPYKVKATITWAGATISGVKAVIVGTVEDGKEQTPITTPLALTKLSGTPTAGDVWSGVLAATETMKLLSVVTDPKSKVTVKSPIVMVEVTGSDADGSALKPVLYSAPLEIGRNPFYVVV